MATEEVGIFFPSVKRLNTRAELSDMSSRMLQILLNEARLRFKERK